jgi:hypothetical protein
MDQVRLLIYAYENKKYIDIFLAYLFLKIILKFSYMLEISLK